MSRPITSARHPWPPAATNLPETIEAIEASKDRRAEPLDNSKAGRLARLLGTFPGLKMSVEALTDWTATTLTRDRDVAGKGSLEGRFYPELTAGGEKQIITRGGSSILDHQGLETLA